MVAYFVKYYGDKPVLVKMESSGKLNQSSDTKAYVFRDGKYIESPYHVTQVLYGGEYDEISKEEADGIAGAVND